MPDAIGAAYVEMPDFDGPTDFLAKLRLGRPVGHHWDEPRPWAARVLPEHDDRIELPPVPILHAIVLGLVQGLSEFLPISSSGHLLLVPWLFDWHDFDNTSIEKAFDVALHLGTLVAVVAYFRHELVVYVREGIRLVVRRERPATPEGRLAWLLVLSSIPAAIVGALFEKTIDDKLGTPGLIAVSMIVFGLLLAVADRRNGRAHARRLPQRRRPEGRCRAGAGPEPGHVAVGHHDHGGAVPGVQPRRRSAGELPDGDPGHRRRRRLQDAQAGQGRCAGWSRSCR